MKKAIVTVGISASGKSTFASEWVKEKYGSRVEINRDEIRAFIVQDVQKRGPFTWAKWKWRDEKEVTQEANNLLENVIKANMDVIVSDTNLTEKYRVALIAKLESYGYEVEIKEFPIDIEEAWSRDAARLNGVGHSVIAKQHEQFMDYMRSKPHYTNTDNPIDFPNNPFPKYIPDTSKPKCILVDIDGTLAHMNGKRGAFEWDKVHLDDVDYAVLMMVNFYNNETGNDVIILSGRDGVCKPETERWLKVNGVFYNKLIMRKPDDMRKDTIVKEEIFFRDIADNYNVQLVIDDRPSVCRMWRSIGLKVFQVGNPAIEF